MRTLYITSCQLDLPQFKQATAPNGPVYAVDVGFTGIPETPFAG